MKKILKWLLFIFVLFCLYQVLIFFFIKEHDATYIIGKGKEKYTIQENFKIIDKKHIYTFEIIDSKKRKYHLQLEQNLHKRNKIIEKIETFSDSKKNLTCIYPIFLNDAQSDIICVQNKQELSSTYLLQKEDETIQNFIEQLKKKGYQNAIWEEDYLASKTKDLTYYKDAFLEKEVLYLWNYKGITRISKNGTSKEILFDVDKYENNQSILAGTMEDTLVVIDTDQKYDFDKLYLVSLKEEKQEEIKLKNKIPQDSYFCGSVGNKVYLIDRKNIRQYEIDIQKKTVKLVGNKESNAKYYNGKKFSTRNIYDFIKEDIVFEEKIPSKISKAYKNAIILKGTERYYLIEKNQVSYIPSLYPNQPVKLFEMNDLKEVKTKENALFFIYKDTVYQYDTNQGLRKLFTSRELLFNQKNMYGVSFTK